MSFDPRTNEQTYRLIVTRRGATELLLNANGPSGCLPQVIVRSGERLAVQLNEAARNNFGLKAYCLLVPSFSPTPEAAPQARYAVMESVGQNGNAPARSSWVSTTSTLRENALPSDELDGLKSSLEELGRYAAEPRKQPFAKPGWITELFNWAQDRIVPLELKLTGGFEQLNASPSFSLIRMETTGPALWFKATGKPNLHELPVTCTLARLFPTYLPELLSVRPPWNGWLSRECQGETLDALTDVSAWTQTAKTLARLEIASIGKSRELLACGCKDLTLTALAGRIDPFLSRMSERMTLQKSEPPAILSNADLAFLGDELKQGCSTLEHLGLPDVLGHLDFNPGNVVVSSEKCVFLDWAEGSVVRPFITFSYLREHAVRSLGGATETQDRIAAAYLEPWQSLLSPSEISRAMAVSSTMAVFAYALAVDEQTSPRSTESPASAGFLRSLARRMHREAVGINGRSALCRH
jgi:hypothetical protein